MSHKDELAQFAAQIGFRVEDVSTTNPNILRVTGVPCLLRGQIASTCSIETSYNPATGQPDGRIGGDVHAVRITTNGDGDGRVYEANGSGIGNLLSGDGRTWSDISVKKGTAANPERDETPRDLLCRYAKRIVGATYAAGDCKPDAGDTQWPFKIPNTFESRTATKPVRDRIRRQQIAVIGLGGTGSHVLDLLAKIPVEIHLLDADYVEWHNLMRAPGAPTADQIEQVREGTLLKVDYYLAKYEAFREAIHAHPIRVESPEMFAAFLAEHSVNLDFAFVCIDQQANGDSPRQDAVYQALTEVNVPFIDSGVSVTLDNDTVAGSVTTSAYEAGSHDWQSAIPAPKVTGYAPGYQNVQLPEVNQIAASLAVMMWCSRTGQYAPESTSSYHKMRFAEPEFYHA